MIRAQHNCPFTELTKAQPTVTFTHWCNSKADILEVECPDAQSFEEVQKGIGLLCKKQGTRIISKSMVEGRVQFVAKTCACLKIKPSIHELMESNNCLGIAPAVYTGGWEQHRVIGFRDFDLRNLLKKLDGIGRAEVVYKREIPEESIRRNFTISINSLLGGLTHKQYEALVTALQNGYYAIPKRVTTGELAKKRRIPRTTFEEHVRKAESKVLHALVPFMMMDTGPMSNSLAKYK